MVKNIFNKNKLYAISEIATKLNIVNRRNSLSTNIIRFWETKFTYIKAKRINGRRYFTQKQMERIKLIKFLLKEKKMTIDGAKKFIKSANKLDDDYNLSIKTEYLKDLINLKTKNILNKIKVLKKLQKNGKKNSLKSTNGA